MTRNELKSLHTASVEAFAKVKQNAHKLAWLDATRRDAAYVIYLEPQLAKYEEEYKAASAKFAAALSSMNWETSQVVEFLTEAA